MQWFVSRRALDDFIGSGGRARELGVSARAKALRERIKARVGVLDVVELLEESRRSNL